ncbi:exodeoxyribonuclease VII small subunit [Algicola sagamiensis]|uniref:exodeoxyribonuclease VII small subunit n=1 Tax=Algicola sagamiensis TaxID=163869 RepID=UPI000361DB3A|nr:exodeoxyribonuclease VII small subunit [Algicola sagamiensis]
MAAKKPENMSFEASIEELEQIVSQLESGSLTLEDSLKYFERGIQLSQSSQSKLKAAQQKVQILLEEKGTLENFNVESENG